MKLATIRIHCVFLSSRPDDEGRSMQDYGIVP